MLKITDPRPRRCETCGCLPIEWLSTREVARVLRICEKTVIRMIESGKLWGVRFGKIYRVRHRGRNPDGLPGLDDLLGE